VSNKNIARHMLTGLETRMKKKEKGEGREKIKGKGAK
jgi:hypothetical protein